jgi:uncharacterized protein (TIGR00730 family)
MHGLKNNLSLCGNQNKPMQINSAAVFCGSNDGKNPLFRQHAEELGKLLAEKNIKLIYGGGNKGLMGVVADAVLGKKGAVVGIIPEILNQWERQHDGVTELFVVENMHTRKRMLYEKADAVIILPGGFGTLDELFETLTWNQLSIHDKPIFIMNSGGFYNSLLAHMQKMHTENFLYADVEQSFIVVEAPRQLMEKLQ